MKNEMAGKCESSPFFIYFFSGLCLLFSILSCFWKNWLSQHKTTCVMSSWWSSFSTSHTYIDSSWRWWRWGGRYGIAAQYRFFALSHTRTKAAEHHYHRHKLSLYITVELQLFYMYAFSRERMFICLASKVYYIGCGGSNSFCEVSWRLV